MAVTSSYPPTTGCLVGHEVTYKTYRIASLSLRGLEIVFHPLSPPSFLNETVPTPVPPTQVHIIPVAEVDAHLCGHAEEPRNEVVRLEDAVLVHQLHEDHERLQTERRSIVN